MKLVEIQPSSLLTTLSVLSRRSLTSFCWFSGSTVRMLTSVVTFFVTSMVVFMMFSSRSVVLCPYTMKTILLVTTDRSGKKDVDSLELASTTMPEPHVQHGPICLEQSAFASGEREKIHSELAGMLQTKSPIRSLRAGRTNMSSY